MVHFKSVSINLGWGRPSPHKMKFPIRSKLFYFSFLLKTFLMLAFATLRRKLQSESAAWVYSAESWNFLCSVTVSNYSGKCSPCIWMWQMLKYWDLKLFLTTAGKSALGQGLYCTVDEDGNFDTRFRKPKLKKKIMSIIVSYILPSEFSALVVGNLLVPPMHGSLISCLSTSWMYRTCRMLFISIFFLSFIL